MTDREDALVHRDKFLRNKVDIKGRTEVMKKVLEIRYAIGTVASGAYPILAPHGLRVPFGDHPLARNGRER